MEIRKSALESMVDYRTIWRGRRVLITGHTGFKGSWLSLWLVRLGAIVSGYGLEPPTKPSLFKEAKLNNLLDTSYIADIRDLEALQSAVLAVKPEIIFHLAAQPLVKYSYTDPVGTYSTNVMGTVNLFEAVRSCSYVRAIINVTTDKVYANREWVWGYRETDRLGGYDPYSNSKVCSEYVTAAFRDSFFSRDRYNEHRLAIATARSGNVIGGGDWAQDRLVPDCIRAFINGEKVILRYPKSTRPWQYVLEPLFGYMKLARSLLEKGLEYGEGWNFAPERDDAKSVEWIVNKIAKLWGDGADFTINDAKNPHEAGYLALDNSKAKAGFGWKPIWNLEESLSLTVKWFKAHYQGAKAFELCNSDIEAYESRL